MSTPKLRRTKAADTTDDEDWTPRRSIRLANKSKFREAKPEAQARKVMMRRLGLDTETENPEQASFDEFHVAFKQPLASSTKKAMGVLFPGRKQRQLGAVRAA